MGETDTLTEEEQCGNCAFFEAWARQRDPWRAQGDCKRHAPVVIEVAGGPKGMFPRTSADRWCGDWEEAE